MGEPTAPSDVKVRAAAEQDADDIAAVHVAAWRAAYRGLLPPEMLARLSVEERSAEWRRWLAERDGRSVTIVAEQGGRIEGFCSMATPSRDEDARPDTAEVAALYVAPGSWRRGVGRALLSAAMAQLRALGYRQATLWVFADNAAALTFYARFGWVPDGVERVNERSERKVIRLRASLGGEAPTTPERPSPARRSLG